MPSTIYHRTFRVYSRKVGHDPQPQFFRKSPLCSAKISRTTANKRRSFRSFEDCNSSSPRCGFTCRSNSVGQRHRCLRSLGNGASLADPNTNRTDGDRQPRLPSSLQHARPVFRRRLKRRSINRIRVEQPERDYAYDYRIS